MGCTALQKMRRTTKTITVNIPYENKFKRKMIDGYAFRIYGHWVK